MTTDDDEVLLWWLDAPGFRDWLESRRPEWRAELPDSQRRRIQSMRADAQLRVSLAVVDRICCLLDLHINEIPDELWTDGPKTGGPTHPIETRQTALGYLDDGETVRAVSERMGIARATIQHWRDAA